MSVEMIRADHLGQARRKRGDGGRERPGRVGFPQGRAGPFLGKDVGKDKATG
ncbi:MULTISPECIES: hypothetical protein [Methylobacterium]|uniref:hypothetical protein n=1 Tax=Methylobacterium TaxID=407 RepID=UPI0014053307|nr:MULTISPECIES: hypothetical protein [Methylobacterium]MDR7037630.1 hypothetical protein [Methylobacterium sp. BE186]